MANLLLKRIKDWARSITSFRTGDVIPVDGPSGTAKMSKDDLLKETTNTALVNNLAPEFDPTKPNDEGGYAYYSGASVLYAGKNYVFVVNHRSGPWNFSEVEQKPLSSVVDFGSVGEAVNAWLDEHPEATTTVQDGSLTEVKFSDALKLKAIKDYVTPEMFGAKGDGYTDDFAAIQAALNATGNVVFASTTYSVASVLLVKSNTRIYGNGALLVAAGKNNVMRIAGTEHDIYIEKLSLECVNEVGAVENPACLSIKEPNLTVDDYDGAYNIVVNACNFNKGTFGIIATKAKNLTIRDCHFSDFLVDTNVGRGGYGILLQRDYNVVIEDCVFDNTNNGRHDIYISVTESGLVTEATDMCQKVLVSGCTFDHSTQTNLSSATQAINVRHSKDVIIRDCYAKQLMCFVSSLTENGAIDGLVIDSNYIDSVGGDYTKVAEPKGVFTLHGDAVVSNNTAVFVDSAATERAFLEVIGDGSNHIFAHNNLSKVNGTLYFKTTDASLIADVDGYYTDARHVIRIEGVNLKGKIRQINSTYSTGNIIVAPNQSVNATLFEEKVYDFYVYNGSLVRQGLWLSPSLSFDPDTNRFTLSVPILKEKGQFYDSIEYISSTNRTGYYIRLVSTNFNTTVFTVYDSTGTPVTSSADLQGCFRLRGNWED